MTHAIVGGLCGQRTSDEEVAFWMAVDRLRPERLLSILHGVMGDEAFTPLRLLGSAAPNRNHRMLASLAAAESLAAIVTTNFDTAIEQALTQARVPFALLALEADFANWGGEPSPLPLLKLHGSLPFAGRGGGPLDALMEQVGRPLPCAKAQALVRLIETTDLVVVGYSGRDDFDIYPLLYETKSQHTCIWVAHPVAAHRWRRHQVTEDEVAQLTLAEIEALYAEPVVTDPVERLVAAQPQRVRRVVMDTGAALDELCWQLSHETYPAAEEEDGPTAWQKEVAEWAERFRGTEVPARLAERIRAEGATGRDAAAKSQGWNTAASIEELQATLRQQVERGDVVSQSGTLLALANKCHLAGQYAAAVDHWVACLAILSKTHQLEKVRTRTVLDTAQEFTQPIARAAMGDLLGLLASRTGWPLAERALATLEQSIAAEDIRRYLRSYLLSALEHRIDAAGMDEATCEWLRWAIETLSVIDGTVAIPDGIDPANPAHRGQLSELMAEHMLAVGRPIWEQLLAPLAAVDAARPRLVLDLAARWSPGRHYDQPLLPWFTALWLGLRDIDLEERLDLLESLAAHPTLGVQEAAAHSLRVLSCQHGGAVLARLTRLKAHADELVRGNVALSLVETAASCRRESLALLAELRSDRNQRVRALAAQSQRRIRGPLWRRLFGLGR